MLWVVITMHKQLLIFAMNTIDSRRQGIDLIYVRFARCLQPCQGWRGGTVGRRFVLHIYARRLNKYCTLRVNRSDLENRDTRPLLPLRLVSWRREGCQDSTPTYSKSWRHLGPEIRTVFKSMDQLRILTALRTFGGRRASIPLWEWKYS